MLCPEATSNNTFLLTTGCKFERKRRCERHRVALATSSRNGHGLSPGALSRGDLTQAITTQSEGTFAQLASDVNATVTQLRRSLVKLMVRRFAASGASEIAQGTHDLSERTEQQASSLEETASSTEEMTATVKNAESANEANQLALEARGRAESGGDVVAQAVSAMAAISEASTKIADIIGVIDEIAFQTNLLARKCIRRSRTRGRTGTRFCRRCFGSEISPGAASAAKKRSKN